MPSPDSETGNPLVSKHFILSLALLAALLITEAMVFTLVDGQARKDIMGLTFGAFGAWIGASSAYFFGRENIRTATASMLSMKRVPSGDVLTTRLKDIPPRPIPRLFRASESLGVVLGWLAERRERSFAVVLDEDDRFACVLSAEAIYRFISRKMMEGADYEGILRLPAGEAARTLQDGHNFGAVRNAALVMRDAISVRAAGEVMGEENVSVTVVLDENDRPTGYITAEDIRQLSLAAR